jgi:hypothetical protein
MVDNPDKLGAICLHKFASLLKYDELVWKQQIEQCIDQIHREEKSQPALNDQRKRKYHRTDEDTIVPLIDYNVYEVKFDKSRLSSYIFFESTNTKFISFVLYR